MNLSITQDVADLCMECRSCMDCTFLQQYTVNSPKSLANDMLYGRYFARPDIPYMCNLCGRCSAKCREGLDPCGMMRELRNGIVEESIPLPGGTENVYGDQRFPLSGEFALVKRAPSGKTDMMFFPGCSLAGYLPEILGKTWRWLNENVPDCGLFLSCCGSPTADLGDRPAHRRVINRIKATMDKLGCGTLVTACPDCTSVLSGSGIDVVSVYEIMAPLWEGTNESALTWVLHDPCKSRDYPAMQRAVRELIKKSGNAYTEPENTGKMTKCCGRGGLTEYMDPEWAEQLEKERCEELGGDFVTYCGSCRETLRKNGLEGVHVLDLLLGDDLTEARSAEAVPSEVKTDNQRKAKQILGSM